MIYFDDNKYTNWYYQICWRGQTDRDLAYSEKHHIFPRCLGGDNNPKNITRLTAREHFICHWLLTKMAADSYVYWKMQNAFSGFTRKGRGRILTSAQFDRARKASAEFGKAPKSKEMRSKLSAYRKKVKLSDETKKKISKTKTGRPQSPEHIAKRAKSNKDNWTQERRELYRMRYGGRNKKPIRIGDVIYQSVNHAARCMKISPANLRRMIRNKQIIPKYLQ